MTKASLLALGCFKKYGLGMDLSIKFGSKHGVRGNCRGGRVGLAIRIRRVAYI
jgi:hypothetical protein